MKFSGKRGTYRCHSCQLFEATAEEYKRWHYPDLVLSMEEIKYINDRLPLKTPSRVLALRLLATVNQLQTEKLINGIVEAGEKIQASFPSEPLGNMNR